MKKTLAVAAVLAAFAGSAAADVTVYGRVDMGVNFNSDTNTLQMRTGQSSGNRYGLKGSEKISENLTVGFQLEQGFDVDTGADKATTGFHRESRVYVATDYGTFHFGRMGTLSSGVGSVSISDDLTVFGTGYAALSSGDMNYIVNGDTRRNNVVTYQSPKMAGATVYAQVASDEAEGWAQGSNRYYAAAVDYKAGAFSAGLVASLTDAATVKSEGEHKMQVIAGVGYDFGVAKAKLTASYTEYDLAGDESYGVLLGVSAPVMGGTFDVQVGYSDGVSELGKDKVATKDVERFSAAAIFQYPLSKKTSLYVGTGYAEEDVAGTKSNKAEYFAGMLHKF